MIKELINLATHLDQKGRIKEADYLDSIIKIAKDGDPEEQAARPSDSEKVAILIAGLLELREEAKSGSLEMGIIDDTLGKVGEKPWLAPDHGQQRGEGVMLNDDEVEEMTREYIRSDRSARHIEDAWPPVT